MLHLRYSSCTRASFQVHKPWKPTLPLNSSAFGTTSSGLFGKQVAGGGSCSVSHWSFLGGSRLAIMPKVQRPVSCKKPFNPAYCLLSSQIANYAFTLGTVAVLPFYTLMVIAPNAELTKRSMDNSIPYVILGILYVYLLSLSWTPDTIRLMFASKYWLPELSSMAKMFTKEMTMASVWIHLLVIDLFAARQIFHDGRKNNIGTRHSVSLCLLFCPIGILVHEITKVLTRITNQKS